MIKSSCLILAIVGLGCVMATSQQKLSPVSTQYNPETQHSLHTPIDHSQVYWNFGGSSVMTKKYVRLTPATQGRKGWIWNEYPLVCYITWSLVFLSFISLSSSDSHTFLALDSVGKQASYRSLRITMTPHSYYWFIIHIGE